MHISSKMQHKVLFLVCTLLVIVLHANSSNGDIKVRKGMALVTLTRPKHLLRGTLRASRQERSYFAFQGVRYAKPPVRFQRPEPFEDDPDANITRVDAGAYGESCARWSRFLKQYTGSEDCLYLNIFVPSVNIQRLPVLLYIHGGAFADGESESHGPEFFMDEDVILITINYRLGAMGFLSTGDTVVPGNMGLHDQALAIKWTHDNIANFGGDPNRITIFGESAGGVSVNLHMLYPPNKGLFSRAVSQSGTAHAPWGIQHPLSARIHLEKLTKLVGCDEQEGDASANSEAIVECLRSKSWQELLEAQNKTQRFYPGLSLPFAPVVEPRSPTAFLSEDPDFLMRTGQFLSVPYIVGINEDEGYYVYSEVVLKNGKMLRALNEDFNSIGPDLYYYGHHIKDPERDSATISKKIRDFYFGDKEIGEGTSKGLIDLSTDRSFGVGIEHTAQVLVEAGHDQVYTYLFSFKGEHTLVASLMKKEKEGGHERPKVVVSHADELQYLFKSQRFGSKEGFTKDSYSEKVSKQFVKLWAYFATNGKPDGSTWNKASTKKWTPLQKGGAMFWYELNWKAKVVENYHKERHEFWRQLFVDYFISSDSSDEEVANYLNDNNRNSKTEL